MQRQLRAAELQLFVQQYRRPKMAWEPNDRRYRRDIETLAKRLRPDQPDALLRGEE